MKKRFWLIFASVFASIVLLLSSSCTDKNTSASTLTLTDESVRLALLEEYTLTAEYEGDEDIIWSSSDATIVSVSDDGEIVAKKEGSAIITAKAGESKDTCEVVVEGYLENLFEVTFNSPQMLFYTGETRDSGAILRYAANPWQLASNKSFASSDPLVATVDADGNITAVGTGTATITATFEVKGKTVSGELIVNVKTRSTVEITNDDALTLYYYNNESYGDSIILNVKAYDQGVLVENADVNWSVDESGVVSVSETGVVTALKSGISIVTVTYPTSNGNHTDSVEIKVLDYVTITKELFVAKNRLENGYAVNMQDVAGGDQATLIGARIKNLEGESVILTIEDGKIYFDAPLNTGKTNLVLETENKAYEVPFEIFDMAIKDAEEFKVFLNGVANLTYYLESDINLAKIAPWADENQQSVLNGVLDGKGYSITGLKLGDNSGLFHELNGATIKNLNIIDAIVGNNSGVLAFSNTNGSIIENVYVSIRDYKPTSIGGLINQINGNLAVSNSCVYLPGMIGKDKGFVGGYADYAVTISNCVFIGGNGQIMGENETSSNVVPTVDNATVVCSALEAHKAYKEKLGGLYEVYNTNHPYFALNNANFTVDTFEGLTSEIVELTEDIEPVTLSLGNVTGTRVFSGVLDGNGHSITGLTLTDKPLFRSLAVATIRNVVIEDVTFKTGQTGVFAYQTLSDVSAPSIIDNVYVSVKEFAYNDGNGTGVIIDRCWGPAVFSNVVIYIPITYAEMNSNNSRISYVQGKAGTGEVTLKNCTFIGLVGLGYRKDFTETHITKDENTVIRNNNTNSTNKVTDEDLARMSDQNYEAFTGISRKEDDTNDNSGGSNVSGGNTVDGEGATWSPVVPFN